MTNDAVKLLLSGYWDKSGWKKPSFSADEIRVLDEAGLLRPTETLDHEQALTWAFQAKENITSTAVADAFLYSLKSRDLRYRSALGSFAHVYHMPAHEHHRAEGFHSNICSVCGFGEWQGNNVDFVVLNFERHKWGGVRHNQLVYIAYDLELFKKLPTAPTPKKEDREILLRILEAAASSKTLSALQKSLAKIVKSNDSERSTLCQILAYAGILCPTDCPSFANGFVNWHQRGDGNPKGDSEYPLGWWKGESYCETGVDYWFPDLTS